VSDFAAEVEAFLKKASKEGGTKKPSSDETLSLILAELRKANKLKEVELDLKRFEVRYAGITQLIRRLTRITAGYPA
jgi:hypothetical protein